MISIYTSLYNLKAGIYDWKTALLKFKAFGDEVVVSTSKNNDYSYLELESFCRQNDIILVITDISFDHIAFDGKLKNAALQRCSHLTCCLLDIDEEIPLSQKELWQNMGRQLMASSVDALFIPVLDLFNSDREYKGEIGTKWYLHKNFVGLERGIVNFAKKIGGKIDHTKSDTTELTRNGNLCQASFIINPKLSDEEKLIEMKNGPYVLHYGFLDRDKKQKSIDFWGPVWSNRAGEKVDNSINFDTITYKLHNLSLK